MSVDLNRSETPWTIYEWSPGSNNASVIEVVHNETEAHERVANYAQTNAGNTYAAIQTVYITGRDV